MKMKNLFIFAGMLCAFALLFNNCTSKPKTESSDKKVLTDEQLVQKGEYLVTTIGCGDCHSPKRMGAQGPEVIPELALSGFPADEKLPPMAKNALQNGWFLFSPDLAAAVGPWGISFSANLTSDATGIGNWLEENFLRAIKQGKFKGIEDSRSLLPPMPWQNLSKLADEDLKAIFMYLKSTKPVKNAVPMPLAPADIK
jgi:hypothetical protein